MMNKVIPIESIQVSNDTPGHEVTLLFDGKNETYWKPQQTGNKLNFIQINFFHAHIVDSIDFLFHETANYDILIEALQTDNVHWVVIGTMTVEGDKSYPVRVNIPTTLTKSIKVIFLSFTTDNDNHTHLVPELSEIRINGEVGTDETEPISAIEMVPLPCPKGYYKDVGGNCVSERIEQISPLKLLEQVTLLGMSVMREIILTEPIDLDEITFDIIDKRPLDTDIVIAISIPNQYMQVFHIQKELDKYSVFLNKRIDNVTKLQMKLYTETQVKFDMSLLGKKYHE